jgi:hypothetical protein
MRNKLIYKMSHSKDRKGKSRSHEKDKMIYVMSHEKDWMVREGAI